MIHSTDDSLCISWRICLPVWRSSDSVELLLNSGANPENRNNMGMTALMTATETDSAEIAQILLDKGASIESADYYGQTALMWAAKRNAENTANLLIAYGADVDAKTHSPSFEYEQELRFRSAIDYDPYGKNDYEKTALILAAQTDSSDVLKLLIREKANLEATDSDGHTALMYAASFNSEDCLYFLINAGAKRAAKSKFGKTALQIAKEAGNTSAVNILLGK